MPTFETTRRFERDFAALTRDQKAAFRAAVAKFVADLGRGRFRKGLRVRRIEGTSSIFEMTWSMSGQEGRATFMYGPEQHPGQAHVIWRRCGAHSIFSEP